MSGTYEISPPFIGNGFDAFTRKIEGAAKGSMHPDLKFAAYQAYYAGYAAACSALTGLYNKPGGEPELRSFVRHVKDELAAFSAASRDMGRTSGLGHVRVTEDPRAAGLHVPPPVKP